MHACPCSKRPPKLKAEEKEKLAQLQGKYEGKQWANEDDKSALERKETAELRKLRAKLEA